MKRYTTTCLIVTLATTVISFGGYNVGIYTTTSGDWTEIYDGGGPGQLGNTFTAQSTGWVDGVANTNEWKIFGTLDVAPTIIDTGSEGGVNYTTYLTGYTGQALIGYGPWGSSSQFSPASFTITAQSFEDGRLMSSLYFERYMAAIPQIGFPETTIILSGEGVRTGYLTDPDGHYGTVDTATVTIIPEPATMALLGLGVLVSRKMKR